MRNTGITYTSAERSPVILPEMAELLPPLSEEQLSALEADLIQNGCYAPVIVNEDMVIIDGHNRQALCEKHGLPYTMAVFSFEDLLEAKQWALDTQKGRRNLEKWELGKIALKLKPEIEAKARANMAAGGQNFRPSEAEEGSATIPAGAGSAAISPTRWRPAAFRASWSGAAGSGGSCQGSACGSKASRSGRSTASLPRSVPCGPVACWMLMPVPPV